MRTETKRHRRHVVAAAVVCLSGYMGLAAPAPAQQAASQDTAADLASQVSVRPGALVQMRFTTNHREPPADEDDWIQGFQLTRVRLTLSADYADRAGIFVRAGTDAGGNFKVERAYADLYFGSTTVRVGQFYLPGDAELMPSPDQTLATDYSPTGYTFDVGATQGVIAVFRPGGWRVSPALSAGLRAGFSQTGATGRADLAGSVYVERRLIGVDWSAFSQPTAPRGSATALKVGLGSTYQSGGETGDTDSLTVLWASADVEAKGNGWNALGQLIYQRSEPGDGFGIESGQTFDDLGFVVQGGAFVSSDLEIFLRYDQVIPDGKQRDPAFSGGTGTDDFRTLTGGFSFYTIPGSSLGKVSVDYQYMFDAQATSIVPTAFNSGVFASTGPQWTLRLQLAASF